MADTNYPLNHPLAVKLWSKRLMREALKETFVYRLMGESTDSICQVKTETQKSAGDRIRCGLRMQLSGAGVQGDATLEGQEEALTTYTDDIFIDQLRHAVRSNGKMSEQRVFHNVRDEALSGLRDWWADRMDTSFFNQVCGNTGQSDTRYTGNQATIAASTTTGNTRIIYGAADMTTENSLSSSIGGSQFQLTMVDEAIALARTATPLIRPARTPWGRRYVAVLHPYQVRSMRTDATAGRVTWYDAYKARIQGGELADNLIFNGGTVLGEYNGTVLIESSRIPLAPSTTTVYRAIFLGAQAAGVAFGQDNGPNRMSWHEESFDYGNKLGVEAGCIFGLKKFQFNSNDFGTVVMSSYGSAS